MYSIDDTGVLDDSKQSIFILSYLKEFGKICVL